MSIQTTVRLTRKEAEEKFIEMSVKDLRKKIKFVLWQYTDEMLEKFIEEKFYNYTIVED